mmetsp:Transcript_7022/g.17343  ORF Transcript_7022/g.17343 Transcript_7022/m.17343 type:complete len:202 (+) Transcript_7022:52-657(+)
MGSAICQPAGMEPCKVDCTCDSCAADDPNHPAAHRIHSHFERYTDGSQDYKDLADVFEDREDQADEIGEVARTFCDGILADCNRGFNDPDSVKETQLPLEMTMHELIDRNSDGQTSTTEWMAAICMDTRPTQHLPEITAAEVQERMRASSRVRTLKDQPAVVAQIAEAERDRIHKDLDRIRKMRDVERQKLADEMRQTAMS